MTKLMGREGSWDHIRPGMETLLIAIQVERIEKVPED
jgi:hypothetical protein